MKTYKQRTLNAIQELIHNYNNNYYNSNECPFCLIYTSDEFDINNCKGCYHDTVSLFNNLNNETSSPSCFNSNTFIKVNFGQHPYHSDISKRKKYLQNLYSFRIKILKKELELLEQLPDEAFRPSKAYRYKKHKIIEKIYFMDYK